MECGEGGNCYAGSHASHVLILASDGLSDECECFISELDHGVAGGCFDVEP